ncbi:MAG: sulfotransferase family protein [Rhodanobacteraceae bacterium]|nr:MAG: sulfotransferase family protein [Rhodanobacteraceae bacterium]
MAWECAASGDGLNDVTNQPILLPASPSKAEGAIAPPPSPVVARLLARARREWEAHQFEAAKQSLASALALAPDDPRAVRMLGMVARSQGDYAKAVEYFQKVLGVWPEDPFLRIELGLSLASLDEVEAATSHFRCACELAPDSASAWFNLGETLWRQARGKEAVAALQRTLELEPAHVEARLSLARAQAGLGHFEKAVAEWREVVRRDPVNADAWYGLSLNADRFDAVDTAQLQHAFARRDLPARAHYLLSFALVKALEDQGDFAKAFEVLQEANAAQRANARTAWDAAGERGLVDAILAVFADVIPPPTHSHPGPCLEREGTEAGIGKQAIFVTGMPRSGTTLVEQILASHSDVEGANEISNMPSIIDEGSRRRGAAFPAWVNDASSGDWRRLGNEYLARTARWRAHKPRFVDKHLSNWHFAGAILAMLPAARVIIVRRDPVETCLACYRHCFTDAAGFATDLDDLADYCNGFMRLTRFWLDKYPDRVFVLDYESLVANPEPVIRDVLDFCGLSFEPACLAPHETSRAVLTPSAMQVRQPIKPNAARAGRYGNKLERLRQRLHDAV